MHKVFSISLGRQIFQVEEPGYNLLLSYLEQLKSHFSNDPSRDEIIGDIEFRLAELLRVIPGAYLVLSDIEKAIETLGRPEDIAGEENAAPHTAPTSGGTKRLFRDPENEVISGVCGGLGAYFNTDPLWFRLAFLGAFFFFGTGIVIYIILAVAVPKATTAADRLMMQGETPNIRNIEESIKAKASEIKKEIRNSEIKNSISGFFQVLGKIIYVFFRIIGGVITAGFIFAGLALSWVLFFGDPEFHFTNVHIAGTDGFRYLFDSDIQYLSARVLLGLLVLIPTLMLILRGISWLGKSSIPKAVFRAGSWIISALVLISIFSVIGSATRFRYKAKMWESHAIQNGTDTLNIHAPGSVGFPEVHEYRNGKRHVYGLKMWGLRVTESSDSNYHLVVYRRSRGSSEEQAQQLVRSIPQNFKAEGNMLSLPEYTELPAAVHYRFQEIRYEVQVPFGKYIRIPEKTRWAFADEWDDDWAIGRQHGEHLYRMGNSGLKCVDCQEEYSDSTSIESGGKQKNKSGSDWN